MKNRILACLRVMLQATIIVPSLGFAADAPSETAQSAPQAGVWQCVQPHAAFCPRDTAESAVFAGKMWISNGWYGDGKEQQTRDLWSSSDGISWDKISDSTPYDIYSELVVFDKKLWAIKSSVWNTVDGVHWNKMIDKTPFGGRGYDEVVVFKDRIWELSGGPDVWDSQDGKEWTRILEKAPYGDRTACGVTAFKGKLWLMGGKIEQPNHPPEKGYKNFTTFNDVWRSSDGKTWTRVIEHAPWSPRMWSIAAVYADRLWLIGGYSNATHKNLGDVWTTTDGVSWEEFKSPTRFAPRHEVSPYVYDGSLWVVAGNTWPVVNDVWRLTWPTSAKAMSRPERAPAR